MRNSGIRSRIPNSEFPILNSTGRRLSARRIVVYSRTPALTGGPDGRKSALPQVLGERGGGDAQGALAHSRGIDLSTRPEIALGDGLRNGRLEWTEVAAPATMKEVLDTYDRHHTTVTQTLQTVDSARWEGRLPFMYEGQQI